MADFIVSKHIPSVYLGFVCFCAYILLRLCLPTALPRPPGYIKDPYTGAPAVYMVAEQGSQCVW